MRTEELSSSELLQKMAKHLLVGVAELSEKVVKISEKDKKRRYRGKIRFIIYQRDGGKCFYCERKIDLRAFHVDHVYPHSKGGQTVLENGVASCVACNLKKGARIW